MIFFQLIKPWWKSEEKLTAWTGLVVILLLNLCPILTNLLFNKWSIGFYNSLQQLDKAAFVHALWNYSWIIVVYMTVICASAYVTSWYALRWRRWFTHHYLDQWVDKQAFYRLMLFQNVDNPDQRISEDLNEFTSTTTYLAMSSIKEIGNAIAFIGVLGGIAGASYLVWVAIGYSILGLYVTIKIGKPLIKLNFQKEKVEANFRYQLVRIRERREEIAFYQGGPQEHIELRRRFIDIWRNTLDILKQNIYLTLTQQFYLNLIVMLPTIAAAPELFSGVITFGVLMQISGAFSQLQGSLSTLTVNYQKIAQWRATSKRLIQFTHTLRELQSRKSSFNYHIDDHIELRDVTLKTPDGRLILDQINYRIEKGERVVIQAPSGSGKTTLMRALARMWPYGDGDITLPESIFFSPQRCYVPLGDLRHAISYPSLVPFNDEQIKKALNHVQLGHLTEYLNIEDDWLNRLSQGEQQRLAIARILLHKPACVFMDEPTAALDEEMAHQMFDVLLMELPNSSIVVVSHNDLANEIRQITLK